MYNSTRTEYVEFVFAQPASSVVGTATPTGITTTSAVVGGTVTVPEGTHVFLRGVCWGTSPSPNIDGDHTTEETGIGSFSSTLEGLSPNTTYYVRAYAVSDYGLAYGNSLFLPAAGYRLNSSLYNAGSNGNYWSSSLNTDYPSYARILYFNSDHFGMSYSDRGYGRSVRPVRVGSQN